MQLSLNRFSIIMVLALPVIFEVLRKYVFYSSIWLIILDAIFFIIFIRTLSKFKPPAIFNYWLIVLYIFTIHGLLFSFFNDRSPISLLFGLRTAFYPLVGFLVASSIEFDKDLNVRLIKVALTLLILIAGFGAAQILLDNEPWGGAVHWINYVPPEIQYGRSMGFGGYDDKVNNLFPVINLYRPHSVFLHTGKFGQVVFGFSALLLVLARDITPKKRAMLMIIIILCNLITFQRAALYPLTVFMFIYIYSFSYNKIKMMLFFLFISFIVIILDSNAIYTIIKSFLSALPEIPNRFWGSEFSVFKSAGAILDNGVLGDGWGYYATGAREFGGGWYSDYYGGEGGWIIMAAEVGIPIVLILFILNVLIGILVFFKSLLKNNDRYLCFWVGFIILLLPVWAGTHNIFGSYLMMLYSTIPIGLYYNKSFNLKIQDNLF